MSISLNFHRLYNQLLMNIKFEINPFLFTKFKDTDRKEYSWRDFV